MRKHLIGMLGGVLLLVLASCTQYDMSLLWWAQHNNGSSHSHSYECVGYDVSGKTLYTVYRCSECDEETKTPISSAVFVSTAEEAKMAAVPADGYVVVTPESAIEVLDMIPDGVTVIFQPGTYDQEIVFRQSVERSNVRLIGDLDEKHPLYGTIDADTYIAYVNEHPEEPVSNYSIYAYRRINDVTLYAVDGAIFKGGVSIDNSNSWNNIKEIENQNKTSYTSIVYISDLSICNFEFKESNLEINIDNANTSDYGIHGLTLSNCNFIGSDTMRDNINSANFAINAGSMKTLGCLEDVVVENCTFEKYSKGMNTGTMRNLTVRGCAFNDMGWSSIGVQGTNNTGDFVYTGNTFNGFNECAIGRAKFDNTKVTISDNTFSGSNPSDGNTEKILVWLGNGGTEPLSNVSVTLSNNTYEGRSVSNTGITNATQDMFKVYAPER